MTTPILLSSTNQLDLLFGKSGHSPQMKTISLVLCAILILIYEKT